MFATNLSKFLLSCCSLALTWLVLWKGWGLSPVSWWWIAGVGIGGQVPITMLYMAVAMEEEK